MSEISEKDRILTFAAQVGQADTPPEDVAKNRGWLDEAGEPTDDGRELLESLDDQSGTRTVFRS